jgi:hypothetical protein
MARLQYGPLPLARFPNSHASSRGFQKRYKYVRALFVHINRTYDVFWGAYEDGMDFVSRQDFFPEDGLTFSKSEKVTNCSSRVCCDSVARFTRAHNLNGIKRDFCGVLRVTCARRSEILHKTTLYS